MVCLKFSCVRILLLTVAVLAIGFAVLSSASGTHPELLLKNDNTNDAVLLTGQQKICTLQRNFSAFNEAVPVKEDAPQNTGADINSLYIAVFMIDGEIYDTTIGAYGEPVILPETPEPKEGYTFSGWLDLPDTMPAGGVTINGSYTVNSYNVIYMVDGAEYARRQCNYGEPVPAMWEPAKTGYTFSGWSGIPDTMPANDITVNGTFTVNTHSLIYIVDGVYYQIIGCDYGSAVTPLDAPQKAGYSFSGWSGIPDTMPDSDVTITGSFSINSYYLIYNVDGTEYQRILYEYGAPITALEEPTKEGYIFEGWSAVPATMPAGDVEVLGTFTKKPRVLLSIAITSQPYKGTQPVQGLFFNPAGMEITAYYDDDSTVVVEVTNALINSGTVKVEPAEFINTGTQPVTITYQGKSGNFTLTVVPKSIAGIAISEQPDKTEYLRGDPLSLTGGEICVSYNNDTQSYLDMTASSISASGYNADSLGSQTVTLTYTDSGGHKFTSSLIVTVDPVVGTPSSPKAAANSYNSVKITWTAVSGASGYAIYRSASSTGNFARLTALTQTSYIDQPLTMGSTYYYKIFAYKTVSGANSYGYSSNTVSAKPLPLAPASPKAVSSSYNSIKISWAAVTGAAGYAIYRSNSSTGTYTKLVTLKTTSYINLALTTGQTYYYKIQAYRTMNGKNTYGPSSNIAFAKAIPGTPGYFKAATVSNTGIKISWSAVPGASGYTVYRVSSSSGDTEKLTNVKVTSYTDKAVIPGEIYLYTVKAYITVNGAAVYGNPSAAVTASLALT